MHAITVNEERGHAFERDKGGICEKVLREEREERNAVIML